jgi:polar amino acid transport system substrate-binding protein
MNLQRARVLVAVALSALLAAACTGAPVGSASPTAGASASQPARQQGIDAVRARGVLYQAFVNAVPFSYIAADGTFTGIDTDVVKECANRLGLPEVLGVQNTFEGLIPGLQAGRFDVIGSAYSYQPERAEVVDNSDPLYTLSITAFVPAGNPDNIHSFDDMVARGIQAGGIAGTTDFDKAKAVLGDHITGYRDSQSMFADLLAGRIRAAIDAETVGYDFLRLNPDADFEVASPFDYPEGVLYIVLWFHPDADDLTEAFNGCIRELKQDGTLTSFLKKHDYPEANAVPVDFVLPGT